MTDRTHTTTLGAPRAMFNSNPSANPMMRGPTVAYAPEDEGGADAAAAAEAARKAKEEADAAAAAAAAAEEAKNKPSDAEAALLKDVMKQKAAAKAAKDALDAANAKLKEFDGLDPAKLRELVAAQAEAERKEAEKRGEYDRILAQVRQDADTRVAAIQAEKKASDDRLAAAQRTIDELTIGSSFRGSKFLGDETVLTGDKARRLYGDHFDIVDGEVVAYDKPRGASDRTPLVDTRTGANLGFEAAIEKIVKADPDFERLAKSKLRPGSGSSQSASEKGADKSKDAPKLQGRSIISAALKARAKK